MYGLDTIEILLAIWSELPDLIGDAWVNLEPILRELLEQWLSSGDDEDRADALIRLESVLEESAPAILQRLDSYQTQVDDQRSRSALPHIYIEQDKSSISTREKGGPIGLDTGESVIITGDSNHVVQKLEQLLAEPEHRVTRYTDISCPDKVSINTPRFMVFVRLTMKPSPYSIENKGMQVLVDEVVQVYLEAPGFTALNKQIQEIQILPDADSPAVVFELQPLELGFHDIVLDFFQANQPIGTITFKVEVTSYEVAEEQARIQAREVSLDPDQRHPDLVLHIAWQEMQEQLIFTLIREGGASFHSFAPITFKSDPATQAAALFKNLTTLSEQRDVVADEILGRRRYLTTEDIDRRLKMLGQDLWKRMIPDELKDIYERERQEWVDRSMLVFSDEPHLPWELLWPYGRGWEDDGPWCMSMRLGRWLRRDEQGNGSVRAPSIIDLNTLAVLAPSDSGLEMAQKEREWLRNWIDEQGINDASPIEASWKSAVDLLEMGGYNWIHVASHGSFYPTSPDEYASLWFKGEIALTPGHIVGPKIEEYMEQNHPGIFFNACHAGRLGWSLTGLGGWANRLISCGAGMFLGPLWTVTDGAALTFAKALYTHLQNGETIAEATRQARKESRQKGDPTWLAYSLYAHPNAVVHLESSG